MSNNNSDEQKQRDVQNNVKNVNAAVNVAAASGIPVAQEIGLGVKIADKVTGGKVTEAIGENLTRVNPIAKNTIQNASNSLAESGATNAIAGTIGAKKALGGNKTSLASPKRANSMVPNNLEGLPPKEEITDEKEETSAAKEESNLPNENYDSMPESEVNSQGKSHSIQGTADKAILKLIKNHPYILIAAFGFGVFIMGLIFLFAILAGALKAGASGTNSGGGGTSASFGSVKTTEACSQLEGKSLSDVLTEKNSSIDKFNSDLKAAIEAAGSGTRAAVVVAATSITSDLCDNYNIRLPYLWGGGHSGKITLASGNWGAKLSTPHYNTEGLAYPYDGLDCSGFVSWAIYNAGYNFPDTLADDFPNYGKTYNMASTDFVAQPGDLIHHNGHIMMIVGVDESAKSYTIAEAASLKNGMRTTTIDFNGGGRSDNEIIDMSSYYDNAANRGG